MTNRVPQRGDRCQPAQVLCTRAAFAQASGVQLPDDPTKPDLFKATLLTHGDTLCTDDREYQAFLEQPLALRNEQIGALRALNEKEKRRKPPEIMDVNRGAVEAMLREPGYPQHRFHRAAVDIHDLGRLAALFLLVQRAQRPDLLIAQGERLLEERLVLAVVGAQGVAVCEQSRLEKVRLRRVIGQLHAARLRKCSSRTQDLRRLASVASLWHSIRHL